MLVVALITGIPGPGGALSGADQLCHLLQRQHLEERLGLRHAITWPFDRRCNVGRSGVKGYWHGHACFGADGDVALDKAEQSAHDPLVAATEASEAIPGMPAQLSFPAPASPGSP